MSISNNTGTLERGSIWQQAWQALSGLLIAQNQMLLTVLRTPTPTKVTGVFTVDPSGCIGGGLDSPNPLTIYRQPMSSEGWLNRITITSPEHHPASPLTQGEVYIIGSTAGEIILFLPISGAVAPVQAPEGRLSAPHLNPGEEVQIVGDLLPVGAHLRIDLQVMNVTGISQYTPPKFAPGEVAQDEEVIA